MRATAARAVCLAALAVGGCSIGGEDESEEAQRTERSSPAEPRPPITVEPKPGEPKEAGSIRSWSAAVNRGDFRAAGSYFAIGAIVEQARRFKLPDRSAAVAFSKSLPCRADVTDVDDEGETVLAAFRLRRGPGGRCTGSARVRFRFRGRRFTEWRQLPQVEEPPGTVA